MCDLCCIKLHVYCQCSLQLWIFENDLHIKTRSDIWSVKALANDTLGMAWHVYDALARVSIPSPILPVSRKHYRVIYWTAKETQMFVQIQFNLITTKRNSGKNVLWTFVFQTVQSGTVFTLFYTRLRVSKTANAKTWLTFIQSNIANFICVSFAVQYIIGLHN